MLPHPMSIFALQDKERETVRVEFRNFILFLILASAAASCFLMFWTVATIWNGSLAAIVCVGATVSLLGFATRLYRRYGPFDDVDPKEEPEDKSPFWRAITEFSAVGFLLAGCFFLACSPIPGSVSLRVLFFAGSVVAIIIAGYLATTKGGQ